MSRTDYFQSNGYELSCVCSGPALDQKHRGTGVIFVHAADANRLGPHRMFVEYADIFNRSGIISMRFDMRGCGDSQGSYAGSDIDSEMQDLANAVAFFQQNYNPDKIILIGISRGAKVCHAFLENTTARISGAILLSTPYSHKKLALKSFRYRLTEYLHKFKDAQSRRKLFTGKANVSQIVKTLTFSLNSPKRYRTNRNPVGFATKCPLYFIYGGKDSITKDAARFYRTSCQTHGIPYKISIIKDSNHSFFHYKWKKEIFELGLKWIENLNEQPYEYIH